MLGDVLLAGALLASALLGDVLLGDALLAGALLGDALKIADCHWNMPKARALKKSSFLKTKTKNAYDL